MNRIGFACKVIGIQMQSCTLRNATFDNLLRISRHNLKCLFTMIEYCNTHNIHLMRIGSDIVPFASHPDISFDWKTLLVPELQAVKQKILDTKLRVSMHPGQYTVLNSPHEHVIQQSIRELKWHADFLDALCTDCSAKMVLHIGGIYNDKKESISRFIKNFLALPKYIQNRLALENDEKNYNIKDVIEICLELNTPAVFDVFHHQIFPTNECNDILFWINTAKNTWNNIRQKIHYSQQKIGAHPGSHSDTIDIQEFMNFYKKVSNLDLDIMLEVKDKNLSALKCIKAIEQSYNQ